MNTCLHLALPAISAGKTRSSIFYRPHMCELYKTLHKGYNIITANERYIWMDCGNQNRTQMNPLKIARKDAGPYDSLLAHEVRNPLTNIDLSMEMLLGGVTEQERKTYMDIIMRSSMRINELTNELIKCQREKEK